VAILIIVGAALIKPQPIIDAYVDVSWPNCQIMAKNYYQEGIVGVTGGLDFHINHCLNKEVTQLSDYYLYVNSGYPGANYRKNLQVVPLKCQPNENSCFAYNYGYNAALYAINYADLQNAHSRMWWIDVETDNSWTNNGKINADSLKGMISAIKSHVFLAQIGIYSDETQWDVITGQWKNNLPVWVATGGYNLGVAQAACLENSFTGGPVLLSQYTLKIDYDLSCSSSLK